MNASEPTGTWKAASSEPVENSGLLHGWQMSAAGAIAYEGEWGLDLADAQEHAEDEPAD